MRKNYFEKWPLNCNLNLQMQLDKEEYLGKYLNVLLKEAK